MNNTYKLNEVLEIQYIQVPYALIANPKYAKLSHAAMLAYGIFLRRMHLSNTNGWANKNDEVFIIYTRAQLSAELNISDKKATAVFKDLAEHGLIVEKRRGQGKPHRRFYAF